MSVKKETLIRILLLLSVLQVLGSFTSLYTGQNNYILDQEMSNNLRYYSWFGYLLLLICLFRVRFILLQFFYCNKLVLVFLSYFLFSCLWSEDVKESFRMMLSFIFQLTIGLNFIKAKSEEDILKRLAFVSTVFFVSTLLFCAIWYDYSVEVGYFDGSYEGALKGFLSSKNVFGFTVSILLFFAYVKFLDKPRDLLAARVFGAFILLMGTTLLFMSSSVTSYLGFFIPIILYSMVKSSYFAKLDINKRIVLLFLSIFILLCCAFIVPLLINFLGRDLTFTGRTYIWDLAFYFSKNKPLFGFGVNSFWREMLELDLLTSYGLWNIAQAHNSFVEALLSGGYIGLILLCAVFLHFITIIVKNLIHGLYVPHTGMAVALWFMLLIQSVSESSLPYTLRLTGVLVVLIAFYSKSMFRSTIINKY